jgi:hypothetical protein
MRKTHFSWVKTIVFTLAISEAALIFIGLQFIPYGRGHNDPPVKAEPAKRESCFSAPAVIVTATEPSGHGMATLHPSHGSSNTILTKVALPSTCQNGDVERVIVAMLQKLSEVA